MVNVPINVQKAASVNAEVAHILVEVPHAFRGRVNEAEIATSVSTRIRGSRLLPGSLHKTGADGLYGMFIASTRRTIPLEQASASGMKPISDTVFQDADDDIWSVQSDGTGSYLVASGSEDIAGLLAAVQVRAVATASAAIDLEEHFEVAQPVLYYDTVQQCTAFGLGLEHNRVYNAETASIEHVVPTAVLAVYDGARPQGLEVAARTGPKSDALAVALKYYSELYGHNAEFLARIKKMLKEAVAA